ncbi:hypothetical protein [Legionella sp. 31fI33]|uniref:hypothetical protein n=1 Tax=Legionella sp. 31fI33 TaxID=2886376 RepID=UPI001E595DF8|nr:hypothetical protein [Legionella sp. 31fI33]MCC5016055.1 hypothetical protein [Legionella sp. 31fI33]
MGFSQLLKSWVPKVPSLIGREGTTNVQLNQRGSLGSPSSYGNSEINEELPERLFKLVSICCDDSTEAQLVIMNLLSKEDEQDIINGLIAEESLREAIKNWRDKGRRHISGKPCQGENDE